MATQTPPQNPNWSTLSRLAGMHESERRRLLRAHKEGGIDSTDENEVIQLREQLDHELEDLALIELMAEFGHPTAPETIKGISPFAALIRDSPSFAQYLNSYLSFGIRFAAGRLKEHPCKTDVAARAQDEMDEMNERPVGLPAPPGCEGVPDAEIASAAKAFLAIPRTNLSNEALKFLDDFAEAPEETTKFELWLRGLYSSVTDEPRFKRIAQGLYDWALSRFEFYVSLEERTQNKTRVDRWRQGVWTDGKWQITNPLAARCGIADFYWLARILRAEVSSRAVVSYQEHSWLSYLPSLKTGERDYPKDEILRIKEVLRSVFDFACELIQNAVEMCEMIERKNAEPCEYPQRPSSTMDWRAAFDLELKDIANQRRERNLDPPSSEVKGAAPDGSDGRAEKYWSKRIKTGESEQHLVGVALSGGGIRSATFNLGVLQGLKELDRLRQVDYLSTVSGGGYIGAWLLGNVRRTRYWLSKMTSWEASVAHLRNYSKYLAPQSGFLSADSWVIWGTWIRNAFLIQLNAVAWLAAAFVTVLVVKPGYDWIGNNSFSRIALGLVLGALAAILAINLWSPTTRQTQHRWAIGLAWGGAFVTAALLWKRAEDASIVTYSSTLKGVFTGTIWPTWETAILLGSFVILAFASFWSPKKLQNSESQHRLWIVTGWIVLSLVVGVLTLAVAYLGLAAVLYLFHSWKSDIKYLWFPYVFGPILVLLAATLAIIIFIGLISGTSRDWKREWWTRYGSWLAIYGAGLLALSLAAVFGPRWIHYLFSPNTWQWVKWSSVVAWIGSTVAGLMAGNSNKTKGGGQGSSQALEWVARIGAVLFIAGAVLAVSTILRFAMLQICSTITPGEWWSNYYLFGISKDVTLHTGTLPPPQDAIVALPYAIATLAVLLACATIFSWRFNINIFGMNQFYRNRLVRCYLGATRWQPGLRHPQGFTGFDEKDDIPLEQLRYDSVIDEMHFRGPFPILNCSLNLGGSSDLSVKTRQSASFSLTPLHAGCDRPHVGFAPVSEQGFAGSPKLGQGVSISGAAASPNMGYNTSPLVAILLTMFNVRLAWWFPNPGGKHWQKGSPPFSLSYLILEFFGLANDKSNFVNVSDGGHFENLGIYELVRRRAKVIIACDAECDPDLAFGSLGNVIRICDTDFGAKIEIDVDGIRKKDDESGLSHAHCAVGRIIYSNGSLGYLIYLKASITGDEDVAVRQYRASHPDFPHQSTADQFFTEDQFESYRRLGHHIATLAFAGAADKSNMVAVANKLYDLWAPTEFSSTFVNHTRTLDQLWERFRTSPALEALLQELVAGSPVATHPTPPNNHELSVCLELLQLMENVFLDLHLDESWQHPDNRGWVILFTMWAKSPKFRAAWNQTRQTFGIRFEYFCEQRLGLEKDYPVVRV